MKRHLKSLAAPNTWKIKRKENDFITRPNPGHDKNQSISLILLLKELNVANTQKEAKYVLTQKNVMVNGKVRNDIKYPVSVFDIITIVPEKKSYTLIIDEKGKLVLRNVADASKKLTKLTGKITLPGKKMQYNFIDGTCMLAEKSGTKESMTVGDSVILKIPDLKIEKVLPLKSGAKVYSISGSQKGKLATLKSFDKKLAVLELGTEEHKTNKDYVFVVGDFFDKVIKE